MWKWMLRQAIKTLARPVVDAVIEALDNLAQKSSNTIDDALVAKLREFREALIGWILANADQIIKSI